MPAKPTRDALIITGEAAMNGVHAVVDLATCTPGCRTELRERLSALVRDMDLHPDVDRYRALTVTLIRLLHRSVERLVACVQPADSPQDMLLARLRREDQSTQDLAVAALDSPRVSDLVAALGYGAESPADPVEVGIAAAAVLRELLAVRAESDDPLRRWGVLSRVSSAVMAKHYLY